MNWKFIWYIFKWSLFSIVRIHKYHIGITNYMYFIFTASGTCGLHLRVLDQQISYKILLIWQGTWTMAHERLPADMPHYATCLTQSNKQNQSNAESLWQDYITGLSVPRECQMHMALPLRFYSCHDNSFLMAGNTDHINEEYIIIVRIVFILMKQKHLLERDSLVSVWINCSCRWSTGQHDSDTAWRAHFRAISFV